MEIILVIILAVGWTGQFVHDLLEEPEIKYIMTTPKRFTAVVPRFDKQKPLPAFIGRNVIMVKKSDMQQIIKDRKTAKSCIEYVNEELPKVIKQYNE